MYPVVVLITSLTVFFFLVGMFLISEIDVFILSCGYTFQTYAESKGQNLRLTLHSTRSIQMSMMD
jgi:hypothetical protein